MKLNGDIVVETDAEQLLFGFEEVIGKQVNVYGGMAGDERRRRTAQQPWHGPRGRFAADGDAADVDLPFEQDGLSEVLDNPYFTKQLVNTISIFLNDQQRGFVYAGHTGGGFTRAGLNAD